MRFRVTCNVDSATFVDGEYQVSPGDLIYTLTPDGEGRLVRISITALVSDVERFRSQIIENPNLGVKAHYVYNFDQELLDRIIAEFQRLESHICFSFRLDGINWQNPKIETICDTDEERKIAKIFALEVSRSPRENPVSVSAQEMAKLIVESRKYDSLTVPMAFYREGMNDYRSRRYIVAFFNFYFIVEGLFGRAKTKKWQIEQQFKSSVGLRWAVDGSIAALRDADPRIYSRVVDEVVHAGRTMTTDGMIEHLVRTRGRLHHFTHNPARLEGTPFTNPGFEAVTEIARGIATFSILHWVVELNNGRDPSA
jgi:hypothetical protein